MLEWIYHIHGGLWMKLGDFQTTMVISESLNELRHQWYLWICSSQIARQCQVIWVERCNGLCEESTPPTQLISSYSLVGFLMLVVLNSTWWLHECSDMAKHHPTLTKVVQTTWTLSILIHCMYYVGSAQMHDLINATQNYYLNLVLASSNRHTFMFLTYCHILQQRPKWIKATFMA